MDANDVVNEVMRFFQTYVHCVFCLASRMDLFKTSLGKSNHRRIAALIETVNERWKSQVVSYELTKSDVDEVIRSGMMTNAVMHFVLEDLRKSAVPGVRICALEDFVDDDYVSMARGKCERAVTEILSATEVYQTSEYDRVYRETHDRAMRLFEDVAAAIGEAHTVPKLRSTHLANHADDVRKYVCPFLRNSHYVLIVIDFDDETIYTYDSLRGSSTEISWTENEALRALINGERYDLVRKFAVETVPVPLQGYNECGFATLAFMMRIATDQDCSYSQVKDTVLKKLTDAVHVV